MIMQKTGVPLATAIPVATALIITLEVLCEYTDEQGICAPRAVFSTTLL